MELQPSQNKINVQSTLLSLQMRIGRMIGQGFVHQLLVATLSLTRATTTLQSKSVTSVGSRRTVDTCLKFHLQMKKMKQSLTTTFILTMVMMSKQLSQQRITRLMEYSTTGLP
jgi:hypothetical protein